MHDNETVTLDTWQRVYDTEDIHHFLDGATCHSRTNSLNRIPILDTHSSMFLHGRDLSVTVSRVAAPQV